MSAGDDMDREDDVLAAEYVLGVLPHGERVAFAARLEREPGLRALVAFWEQSTLPLAEGFEEVEAPARTLAQIEQRLFGPEAAKPGLWASLGLWRALTAAAMVALIAGALWLVPQVLKGPVPVYVAEVVSEDQSLRLVAVLDPPNHILRLNRIAGQPAEGRDLELWIIEGGNAPVSLGVLSADAAVHMPIEPARGQLFFREGAVLAISDEPRGGSPTGQPTGAVLAVGAVTEL